MNKLIIGSIVAVVAASAASGAGVYLSTKNTVSNGSTGTVAPQATQLPITDKPSQNKQQITQNNCLADTCLQVPNLNYPVSTLPQSVQDALTKSLDNEYKLRDYYQAVINKFGDTRPFSMIIGAEDQHIAVLTSLFQKYGLTILADNWANQTYSLSTFQLACQTSVTYEQDTVDLYNNLSNQVTNYPDIMTVFTSIKEAAQNNHLPAFDKCSS